MFLLVITIASVCLRAEKRMLLLRNIPERLLSWFFTQPCKALLGRIFAWVCL